MSARLLPFSQPALPAFPPVSAVRPSGRQPLFRDLPPTIGVLGLATGDPFSPSAAALKGQKITYLADKPYGDAMAKTLSRAFPCQAQ